MRLAPLPVQALQRAGWRCRALNPGETEHPVFDCVLLQAREPRPRVIAKCYADPALGARTYRVMLALDEALAAREAVLRVPRALSYDPASGLLLQQRVDGAPYAGLLAGAAFRRHLRLAGAALAALHALPAPPAPPKSFDEHVDELMRPHPAALCAAQPRARARIERLLAALGAAARGAAADRVAWLHRDFHVKQLILREGRVCVIDWDLAASGDPALDVGNFLLNLDKHLAHRAPLARDAFAEGYARAGDAAVLRRAPLYEAFNSLRRACKAFRSRRPGWTRAVMERIDAAERRLHHLSR